MKTNQFPFGSWIFVFIGIFLSLGTSNRTEAENEKA